MRRGGRRSTSARATRAAGIAAEAVRRVLRSAEWIAFGACGHPCQTGLAAHVAIALPALHVDLQRRRVGKPVAPHGRTQTGRLRRADALMLAGRRGWVAG